MNIINNIIKNSISSEEPLNIIVAPHDGIFELSLAENTKHNFYLLNNTQRFLQPTVKHNRLFNISNKIDEWNIDLDIDLIICNNMINQIEGCKKLSKILHTPLLIINHGIKPPFVKLEDIQILNNEYINDTTVSMNIAINHSWYTNNQIMPYYIPDICANGEQEEKILIVGNFHPSHLALIEELKKKSPLPITVVGHNPQISENTTLDKCINLLKTHKIFINLYDELEVHPIMLYAMSAGCTIITTVGLSSSYIIHKKNGYIIDSFEEILYFIQHHENLYVPAKETIQKYNQKACFHFEWNKLINITSKKPFLG